MVTGGLSLLLSAVTVAAAKAPSQAKRGYTSTIWCGPILYGNYFKTVEASWTIPNVSLPTGGDENEDYFSSQWVGIDGSGAKENGDCTALLQAGTSIGYSQGDIWHYSWTEFFPAETGNIDLDFKVGDEIYVKLTATSKTTGDVYMLNKSTGQKATQQMTAPEGKELCFRSVEWIEEDPGGGLPFPAFETFRFTGAAAKNSEGEAFNLKGSEIVSMVQDGQTLCEPTIESDSIVKFEYKGK
ncbi:hypothetical protein NLG97_g1566 [Lecanicillium saksenae]|uniref:Uncharacterized protein n=1 Tax=Lecanicillium saksenae TaxID=468837 RepID=A0ACC1R7I6_9HYPO|nr:hypothetical protein NLG97_g1566 [Lecanicillium saksenae]